MSTSSWSKDEGGRMKDEPDTLIDLNLVIVIWTIPAFILHPSSFILPFSSPAAQLIDLLSKRINAVLSDHEGGYEDLLVRRNC